jgi:hypothetical protein
MSADWETRALEAEAALAAQETKSKQLVELVRKQKSEWEERIATAEAEAAKWKAAAEQANADLVLKNEQLSNVSYRLDSLIALNEKNSKEAPDAERVKDLEGRLALHQDAAATHRAEVELAKATYKDQVTQLTLDIKLKDRELETVREELKVAHERAFTAETRLGREQALSRDLSSQLNQLRYSGAAGSAKPPSGTTAIQPSSATRTELDDLDIDLGDLDFSIDSTPAPSSSNDGRVSTVTKATVAVAGTPKRNPPAASPKKAQQNWDDIDSLLDDIQSTGTKK